MQPALQQIVLLILIIFDFDFIKINETTTWNKNYKRLQGKDYWINLYTNKYLGYLEPQSDELITRWSGEETKQRHTGGI